MTTIREETREAQRAEFEKRNDERAVPDMEATLAIYDYVDALTPDQRSLLVQKLLSGAHQHLSDSAEAADNPLILAGHLQVGSALIALAGYVTASEREDAGWTSTGDKAVTEVLTKFGEVLKAQVQSMLNPEQQKIATEVIAAAQARSEKGEKYEDALFDEVEKRREALAAAGIREDGSVAAAAPAASTGSFGMYL